MGDTISHILRDVRKNAPGLARDYVVSAYDGYRVRHLFEQVNTYATLIGYARTGSSLLGALLDAHPNVVMGSEANDLKYVLAGFSRQQLYYLLHKSAADFAQNQAAMRSGYSYAVPGQWQGRHQEIRVIGEKHALGTALRLFVRPYLLQRLRTLVGIPVKFIHIYRNPYDCIVTETLKNRSGWSLEHNVQMYINVCDTVDWVRSQTDSNHFLDFKHEDFVADPRAQLRRLFSFIDVEVPDELIEACASIVHSKPNRTREKVEWTPALREQVEITIARWPYLHGYGFDA